MPVHVRAVAVHRLQRRPREEAALVPGLEGAALLMWRKGRTTEQIAVSLGLTRDEVKAKLKHAFEGFVGPFDKLTVTPFASLS